MSARVSRLRLEEELRVINDQEEALDRDVNGLLQVSVAGSVPMFLVAEPYCPNPARTAYRAAVIAPESTEAH